MTHTSPVGVETPEDELTLTLSLGPADPRWSALGSSLDPEVRAERAKRGRLREDDIAALLEDPDERVRAALAGRRELSETARLGLAHDDSEAVQLRLARSRWSAGCIDKVLLGSWHVAVRLEVVTWCDDALLAKAARDDEPEVRAAVARRSKDPDVITALVNDEDPKVRARAEANSHAVPSAGWPVASLRRVRLGAALLASTRAQLDERALEGFAALEPTWEGTLEELLVSASELD
jgi:hypothetical protein